MLSPMNEETTPQIYDRPLVGNLTDFVVRPAEKANFEIEVAVKDDGRVAIFHNMPFKKELSWLEFDLGSRELNFVLNNGDIRSADVPLAPTLSKNMQNSHQVLMILLDNNSGEAKQGFYIPLIIHRK